MFKFGGRDHGGLNLHQKKSSSANQEDQGTGTRRLTVTLTEKVELANLPDVANLVPKVCVVKSLHLRSCSKSM